MSHPGMTAATALLLTLTACAAPAGVPPPRDAHPANDTLPREGSYQRFIVKYRAGSEPSRDVAAAQRRLVATAPGGVRLDWQRRLGVQADLFFTDRPLDEAEAEALMRRFRDDPDVEYIEPETMMGIDPITRPQELKSSD